MHWTMVQMAAAASAPRNVAMRTNDRVDAHLIMPMQGTRFATENPVEEESKLISSYSTTASQQPPLVLLGEAQRKKERKRKIGQLAPRQG